MNTFGELIKKHRLKRREPQSHLAQRCGISRQSICMVEGGKTGVSLTVALKLLRALEVPFTELVNVQVEDPAECH